MIKYNVLLLLFALSCIGANDRRTKPTTKETSQINLNTNNQMKKSIYDFSLKTLDGKEISLSSYKGKKILLVNTASECGYTPQYEALQKFHEKYGNKVVVLGFPANNFGGQEPGSDAQIASFCQKNYGVTFQMFSKISVAGNDQHPLYKWLSSKDENGWNDQAPKWNFCKYVINENGELLHYFGSSVKPFDEEMLKVVE
jgi:glutathione peroxidase